MLQGAQTWPFGSQNPLHSKAHPITASRICQSYAPQGQSTLQQLCRSHLALNADQKQTLPLVGIFRAASPGKSAVIWAKCSQHHILLQTCGHPSSPAKISITKQSCNAAPASTMAPMRPRRHFFLLSSSFSGCGAKQFLLQHKCHPLVNSRPFHHAAAHLLVVSSGLQLAGQLLATGASESPPRKTEGPAKA